MPGYRVHLAGGAIAGLLLVAALSLAGCLCWYRDMLLTISLCGAAVAGALFPDIDVKSKGQNYFYWIIFFLLLYYYATHRFDRCASIAVIAVLPLLTKHRGILHNIWFLLLLIGMCMVHVQTYCKDHAAIVCMMLFFFFVGMVSHLWLDLGVRRMFRLPWR